MAYYLIHDELGPPRRFPCWFTASVEVARLCPGAAGPDGGLLRPEQAGDTTRTFRTRHDDVRWTMQAKLLADEGMRIAYQLSRTAAA